MEITLETLYYGQQQLEQKFDQKLDHLEHRFDQKLSETKADIIKWVVGLFIGAIIVVSGSVALAVTAVMLVTG